MANNIAKASVHDTLNVENPAVQQYMQQSNSTFCEKEGVLAQEFFDAKRNFRPDQPCAKTIHFDNMKGDMVRVRVATDHHFSKVINDFTTPQSCMQLQNLMPGTTYYYKIESAQGKTIKKGKLAATGQVRMIGIESGFNIRDLGGWKGMEGKTIKYGLLYRGGSLGGTDKEGTKSDITNQDRAELYRLGIRAQLDLRAKSNAGKYAGEWSLHSYSRGETTLLEADFNNTMTDYGAYNEDASVVSDIQWIIQELKAGKPVYFNCRQGADRTGTIAFVIEGLLGCYEQNTKTGANQMAMDYELTGFSQANLVDNIKVGSSHRGAAEAYRNKSKLFRQLIDLQAKEQDIQLKDVQQRCYYYLNCAKNICISSSDLDWFIMHMLGLSKKQYAPHRPAWAKNY